MGSYVTDFQDLYDEYGKFNIRKWADLDNNRDAATIATRMNKGITRMEARINDKFRDGKYAIPFAPVPETVKDWAAIMTGIWLYRNRGQDDKPTNNENKFAGQMTSKWNQVMKEIKEAQKGIMKLNASFSRASESVAPYGISYRRDC